MTDDNPSLEELGINPDKPYIVVGINNDVDHDQNEEGELQIGSYDPTKDGDVGLNALDISHILSNAAAFAVNALAAQTHDIAEKGADEATREELEDKLEEMEKTRGE